MSAAWPDALRLTVPRSVVPSKKDTVPVGVPPFDVTVAVKVTKNAGLMLVAVAVAFAGSTAIFNATYRAQSEVDAQLTNGADVTVPASAAADLASHQGQLAVTGILIFAALSLLEWALLRRWHESALARP